MENLEEKPNISLELQNAINDKNLQRIYFNGFIVSIGTGDIVLVLKENDTSIAVVNLSYTVAKTLVQKLGGTILALEKGTGNTIMTTDDIQAKMAKIAEQGNQNDK